MGCGRRLQWCTAGPAHTAAGLGEADLPGMPLPPKALAPVEEAFLEWRFGWMARIWEPVESVS